MDGCLCDEQGAIFLGGAPQGEAPSVAILHDHDLDTLSGMALFYDQACGALGELNWDGKKLEIELVLRAELGRRFGFVASPAADQRRVRGPS